MNYVLILINYFPDYLKFIVNSILSVDKDAKIHICSNQEVKFKNTEFINLNEIDSEGIDEFKSMNIFKGTVFEDNSLWVTSILRIFYLKEISKLFQNEGLVHFDNDVIIYEPFKNINIQTFDKKKFNITPASEKKFVFGYSYIDNPEPLEHICKLINDISAYGKKHQWEFTYGKPFNEMLFLGEIYKQNNNLINPLPTLPYGNSKLVFDPSNYGQYFDGTHMHPKKYFRRKKFYNLNEYIDTEISVKRIKPKFKNNKPFISWENKTFNLVNLHIHSKRFEKFLPKSYKNYI